MKTCYAILLLLAMTPAMAQLVTADPKNNPLYRKGATVTEVDTSNAIGSPYASEGFALGKVTNTKDGTTQTRALRFNLWKNEMEVRESLSSTATPNVILKRDWIEVELNGKTYQTVRNVPTEEGRYTLWMEQLTTPATATAYYYPYVVFDQGKKAENSMMQDGKDRWEQEETYYILQDGIARELRMSRKKAHEAFAGKESELKAKIKKDKLKFKKSDDVVTLVNYFNSL